MEFPGKVNTTTSLPESQTRQVQLLSITMNTDFIKTIPGILLLVEIVGGLLVWAIVCSAAYWLLPAFGWVMFVSVTLWILTIVLFIMLFLGVRQKFTSLPWTLVLLVFYGVATVLYLTAFLANAVSVSFFESGYNYNSMAAAAVFTTVHIPTSPGQSPVKPCDGAISYSLPYAIEALVLKYKFFGIVVTLTYGASTFFAFLDWKGDAGNAAASTVPV